MTEADELAWHKDWRRRSLSAMRLWLNAETFKDACSSLTQVKAVYNEKPPLTNHIPKGKEPTT